MTSKVPASCFVWKWLPGTAQPVVAGQVRTDGTGRQSFVYGRSYLARAEAEPIYARELPLKSGPQDPVGGLELFSCLRDGAPDAWGRRVIHARLLGRGETGQEIGEMTYLLESGSDRVGSLDFQESASDYRSRDHDGASLDDLQNAAELVDRGLPVPPDLADALQHGTTVGGARPKATISDGDSKYVAKFSLTTDTYDLVRAEYLAMTLAGRVGLDVAPVELTEANGRDVLLVRRFDRERTETGWTRRSMVSGLTVLGLDERWAREASYPGLLDRLREDAVSFRRSARELFGRMVFNVLIGNTDDHARNHAFFLTDGVRLSLTPAYDICAFSRAGGEASHAMKLTRHSNLSRLSLCVEAAGEFGLGRDEALAVITGQIEVIAAQTEQVCLDAGMRETTRQLLWRRAILNPDVFSNGLTHLDPK